MNKKKIHNSYIFNKYINNTIKPIQLKINTANTGKIKYLPPVSKEWKNNICLFNLNNLKNLPSYDININLLIKAFFKLKLKLSFVKKKIYKRKFKKISINKIFASKAEINHTNNKALITLYTYNREKIVLLNRIKRFKKNFLKTLLYLLQTKEVSNLFKLKKKITKKIRMQKKQKLNFSRDLYFLRKKFKKKCYPIINKWRKKFILFRRLKLTFDLNKYKFEEMFLFKLSELISQFYNKKVEFNIVKLKSIILNPDLFSNLLSLKIKRKNANVLKMMNFILNKVKLLNTNRILEKNIPTKSVDFNIIENKYKNLHLQSIINKNNLDDKLNEIYPNISSNFNEANKIIFDSIKYKNIGGIKLETKGRLTRRYRAERAVYKMTWKGALRNIDSSYKKLSTIITRGVIKSNLEHSMVISKRRIGAFAVKGWISGK